MSIVDYELQIGDTLWSVDENQLSIFKGECTFIDIKIYKDHDTSDVVHQINYQLTDGTTTKVVPSTLIFESYTLASVYLGTLFTPEEVLPI